MSSDRNTDGRDIPRLFEDDQAIEDALATGVRQALREHKQAGVPVVEWRDGRVVVVPPEEIHLDDDGDHPQRAL
jgi:hypothetical protein